ncbi:MAG: leucine-rich repeat protein [Oscillospiraceae bacterium]|nr:leucine-rich repeat protein [Oscillospiraceae bacterium]
MKRLLAAMLAVCMTGGMMTVNGTAQTVTAEDTAVTSGSLTETMNWAFSDGTLTVSGTGAMPDFTYRIQKIEGAIVRYTTAPWFSLSEEIRRVEIGEGVTYVGAYAFFRCNAAEELVLADTVTSFGKSAFYQLKGITEVRLPEGCTVIPESCFAGCEKLTTAVLPDSLQRICSSAFSDCLVLTDVTLPDCVYAEVNAFANCDALLTQGKYPGVVDDTLFVKVMPDYSGSIPDTVTSIAEDAFRQCDFTRIVLPDSVRIVGKHAFAGSPALRSVTLPEGLRYIGDAAFANCTQLRSLSLPDSLESLGSQMFLGCSGLGTLKLPANLQEIDSQMFNGCTSLSDLTLPEHLTGLQRDAFLNCERLWNGERESGCLILNGQYFIDCTDKCVLHLPEGIRLTADGALKNNQVLKNHDALYEVTCPDSLRIIGAETFADCAMLQTLTLNEGLAVIGENALSGCKMLSSLYIPASVTEIAPQENLSITDIYGAAGSAAEQFAAENGIRFHIGSSKTCGDDMTFDFAKDGWSFGNQGSAFHIDESGYYLTDADRAALDALGITPSGSTEGWSGSCAGLSAAVILAKNRIFLPEQLQRDAETLSEVQPTPEVISFINYYQAMQSGYLGSSTMNESLAVYRMQQAAARIPNGQSPFLLMIKTRTGMHAVVGCGLESGAWEFDGTAYDRRITVWDPNYPGVLHAESCLYFDSEMLNYTIPAYGTGTGTNQYLISWISDPEQLDPYPYEGLPERKLLPGDLDDNGTVDVRDAVLLARLVGDDADLFVSEQGKRNAELDGKPGVDSGDLHSLMKRLAKML